MKKLKNNPGEEEFGWAILLMAFILIPLAYFSQQYFSNQPSLGQENELRCLTIMQSISRIMELRPDQPGDSTLRYFPLSRLVKEKRLSQLPQEPVRGQYRIIRDQGWRVECSLHGEAITLHARIRSSQLFRESLHSPSDQLRVNLQIVLGLLGLILLLTGWYLRNPWAGWLAVAIGNLTVLIDLLL